MHMYRQQIRFLFSLENPIFTFYLEKYKSQPYAGRYGENIVTFIVQTLFQSSFCVMKYLRYTRYQGGQVSAGAVSVYGCLCVSLYASGSSGGDHFPLSNHSQKETIITSPSAHPQLPIFPCQATSLCTSETKYKTQQRR